jgi:rare lipoprotein A
MSARVTRGKFFQCAIIVAALSGCILEAAAADIGMASFYGKSHAGKRMASGSAFDMNEFTAAHRNLPFGTRIMVTNLGNGRSVVVEVADRGPFTRGRIVDVSYAAAERLGFVQQGLARVKLDRL